MKTKDTLHADQSAVLNTGKQWRISKEMGIGQTIVDDSGNLIGYCDAACFTPEQNKEHADLIVRAVNRDHAFEALLETSRAVLDGLSNSKSLAELRLASEMACVQLRNALKQAEPFTH